MPAVDPSLSSLFPLSPVLSGPDCFILDESMFWHCNFSGPPLIAYASLLRFSMFPIVSGEFVFACGSIFGNGNL